MVTTKDNSTLPLHENTRDLFLKLRIADYEGTALIERGQYNELVGKLGGPVLSYCHDWLLEEDSISAVLAVDPEAIFSVNPKFQSSFWMTVSSAYERQNYWLQTSFDSARDNRSYLIPDPVDSAEYEFVRGTVNENKSDRVDINSEGNNALSTVSANTPASSLYDHPVGVPLFQPLSHQPPAEEPESYVRSAHSQNAFNPPPPPSYVSASADRTYPLRRRRSTVDEVLGVAVDVLTGTFDSDSSESLSDCSSGSTVQLSPELMDLPEKTQRDVKKELREQKRAEKYEARQKRKELRKAQRDERKALKKAQKDSRKISRNCGKQKSNCHQNSAHVPSNEFNSHSTLPSQDEKIQFDDMSQQSAQTIANDRRNSKPSIEIGLGAFVESLLLPFFKGSPEKQRRVAEIAKDVDNGVASIVEEFNTRYDQGIENIRRRHVKVEMNGRSYQLNAILPGTGSNSSATATSSADDVQPPPYPPSFH